MRNVNSDNFKYKYHAHGRYPKNLGICKASSGNVEAFPGPILTDKRTTLKVLSQSPIVLKNVSIVRNRSRECLIDICAPVGEISPA